MTYSVKTVENLFHGVDIRDDDGMMMEINLSLNHT